MKQTFLNTLYLIKSDFKVRCDYENKKLTLFQGIKLLLTPAIIALMLYRWQRFFYTHHLGLIASFLKLFNCMIFTLNINSTAEIGERFFLMHASFVNIGPNVKIGKNCMMAHQNAITPSPFYSEKLTNSAQGPTIGDDLIMGGGSAVYGAITLGNRVKVSMNASVETSVGDDAVMFGVPARNVAKNTEEGAA